jgi:murein DD-endopeptidase MepM/ murein hydrolase activator NlpD
MIGDDGDTTPPRLTWPVEGKMRRGFTARGKSDDFHDGIDITAPEGTATRAVASGTVIFAAKEPESFGNLVVIDHGNGWQSAYGFLQKLTVKKGETVKAHERVGFVGHSGKASRDELHFELRRMNKPVDPMEFLPKAKKAEAKLAKKAVTKSRTSTKRKSPKAD